ncbi:hypothetical protein CEXT_92811 [Caerostris extrusa]|uniref:Uncharacterized protein n=1 Tax=Caerostris extrusa TaxID=172846 RepID=A0AAV4NZA2_CAEEX|nr:hypothetical protein CEXT_92811 [Caerostris extrusa]
MLLTQVKQMRQTKMISPGRTRLTLLPLINFLVGSLMWGGKEITAVSKPNSFSSTMQCDSVSITPDPGRATYNNIRKETERGIMLAKIHHGLF